MDDSSFKVGCVVDFVVKIRLYLVLKGTFWFRAYYIFFARVKAICFNVGEPNPSVRGLSAPAHVRIFFCKGWGGEQTNGGIGNVLTLFLQMNG